MDSNFQYAGGVNLFVALLCRTRLLGTGRCTVATLRWREVDSNFQYAGTGESRHPSFVLPDCLGPVGACPGAAGFL